MNHAPRAASWKRPTPAMMKIAALSSNPAQLESLGRLLDKGSPDRWVTFIEGGLSNLSGVAKQQPDLVILAGPYQDPAELYPLGQVAQRYPGMGILLLCPGQTSEFLMHAMRAGVREVLPPHVTREELNAAVARAELKLSVSGKAPRQGRILAFIACKGGSGATFLATNLAHQLATESKKVLLIDFNLQFGDAVLFLHDGKPATNLSDVAHNIDRLDAAFLRASLVQVSPNCGILAAPEDPGQAMEVKPEHVDALLDLASREYDFVILDIGRVLDPVTLRALDRAHQIFPILQMTLPFVRDTNRLLGVFRSLDYPADKICPIINRFEKGGNFSPAEVAETLGIKAFHTIPNGYVEVMASINQGLPIAQVARNSAVTRSLAEFSRSLLPGNGEATTRPAQGWLGRLMQRAGSP